MPFDIFLKFPEAFDMIFKLIMPIPIPAVERHDKRQKLSHSNTQLWDTVYVWKR